MGREVRKVPANWEHPQIDRHDGHGPRPQPMYKGTFAQAAAEWKAGYAKFESGKGRSDADEGQEYWERDGAPPEREYYEPFEASEATWFQVWETVSEGTPVSPPFATRPELVDYLVQHGDFWDQKRGHGGWSRAVAERFVREGWAPSLVVMGGQVKAPRDGKFA